MSISVNSVQPSRRALVRGAAWSVPVVALAATAPAFATSTASCTISGGKADKWGSGKVKHVSWDVTLVNGATEIDEVVIKFEYVPQGGGTFSSLTLGGYSPTSSWGAVTDTTVSPYIVTATLTDNVLPGATRNLHVDFAGADASIGQVKGTASITYVGGLKDTKVIGPVSWGPGNQHSHVGVSTP